MNEQQNESNLNAEINHLEANDAVETKLADLTVRDDEEAAVKGGGAKSSAVVSLGKLGRVE